MDLVELRNELQREAERSGLVGFGVCDAEPFLEVRSALQERKQSGHAADMHFTFGQPERSTDVRLSFPWAQRLVVVASSYLPDAGTPGPPVPGTARIARFSTADHYQPLRAAADVVAGRLHREGFRGEVLVDDNRLVDRAAAVRAGVGWWGKNTMVLRPRHGPWILLGSIVTDAGLPTTSPMQRTCGTCTACLPACPTGALVAPGVLDARLCIAYWAQARGVIPIDVREAWGDRLYGCDDCLDACPPGERASDEATDIEGRVDLVGLLRADDDTLLDRYQRFYLPRRDPRYLRRNALVALAHAPSDDGIAMLRLHLANDDPLLRLHAVWAVGRADPDGSALLTELKRTETNADVISEIDHVLGG